MAYADYSGEDIGAQVLNGSHARPLWRLLARRLKDKTMRRHISQVRPQPFTGKVCSQGVPKVLLDVLRLAIAVHGQYICVFGLPTTSAKLMTHMAASRAGWT